MLIFDKIYDFIFPKYILYYDYIFFGRHYRGKIGGWDSKEVVTTYAEEMNQIYGVGSYWVERQI